MSQSYPPSEAQLPAIGDESEATGEQPVSSPEAPGDRWFLDNRINTLNRNAAEASPAQQVYRTTSAIIVLVRVSALVLLPPVVPHLWPKQERTE